MSMTAVQQEAVNSLLRVLGAAGLAGAGVRAGYGVLRNANPTYDPPEIPKPLIVDMPYAAREAPDAIPLPAKQKKLPPQEAATTTITGKRAADFTSPLDWTLKGTLAAIPGIGTGTPLAGRPDAANPMEIPAYGLAAPPLIAAGGLGGYYLADKILRAADRRNARSDLEAAQKEYRQSVLERITRGQSGKVAADLTSELTKLASAETPVDPDLRRAKVALDAAFDRIKRAEPTGEDMGWNAVKSFLWPGHALGPEAATFNALLAGTGLGLGSYMGYQAGRNKDDRDAVRKRISAVDRDNARKIPAPVIARLIPVSPDKL